MQVGLRAAVVSEDDPNNLILATESGVIVITDLGSEIQVRAVQCNSVH